MFLSPRRRVILRSAVLASVMACGLAGFMMGAEVSARDGIPESGFLTKLYYTLGLFVLGGVDYGTPCGGPVLAQDLLWFAYFASPAVTASAAVEGLIRILRPQSFLLSRLDRHVVVAGCDRLAILYIEKLRERDPGGQLVVVDPHSEGPVADTVRDAHGAILVHGDISSPALQRRLRLNRARRILLLTMDDFTNLDAAASMLELEPMLGDKIVVHVADLRLMRVIGQTKVAEQCVVFNKYQVAADHLVRTEVLAHFSRTEPLDLVVLVGFGRFGQTVLDVLQREAGDAFDRVLILDPAASELAASFGHHVGFEGPYERVVIDGDAKDDRIWVGLESDYKLAASQPVFIVGTGDDKTNVDTAMRLSKANPDATVIVRSFRRSAFADDVSRNTPMHAVSVAALVRDALPAEWIDGGLDANCDSSPLAATLGPGMNFGR